MSIIEEKITNEGTHEFDLTTMTITARNQIILEEHQM
jgi:hypothetical protein